MSSTFGIETLGRGVVRQQVDQFQARQQQADNRTRQATNIFTYTTTGVGQIVMKQPIMFDCDFIEEPGFTSGVAIVKVPDLTHYRYPLVTAGVYRWVKEPQHKETMAQAILATGAGKSTVEDTTPQFYKGAYLYFLVRVDPNIPVRTDGSNLAYLEEQLTYYDVGTQDYLTVRKLIAEAHESLYLAAHPAKVTLHHHLQFTGIAMKKLSDDVTKLADDKKVEPEKPADS